MKAIAKEWLRAAHDDILVIAKIYQDELLSHMAAFHAQQCIEKSFKAILEDNEVEFPKIHKLRRLQNMLPMSIQNDNEELVRVLDELYIESRYPGEFGLLPHGKPTLQDAKEFYGFAQEVFNEVCILLNISLDEIKAQ